MPLHLLIPSIMRPMLYPTDDLRITSTKVVLPPAFLEEELPITEKASATVFKARNEIVDILNGKDNRLLVVVGPCSIHDTDAAREYAELLKGAVPEFSQELCLVMRVYFEKPRTTLGWKGLINDPYLNESFQINDGLRKARHLLLDLAEMGVPAGTEFLDMISPQYVSSLVSWGAIGARTTESQVHRELVSGLSCPVGFKNGTRATSRSPSRQSCPPVIRTTFSATPSTARPQSLLPRAIATVTSFCAAVARR